MGFFGRQPDKAPRYDLDNMHRDIAIAVAKARDAHNHPVLIERRLQAIADQYAIQRARSEPLR